MSHVAQNGNTLKGSCKQGGTWGVCDDRWRGPLLWRAFFTTAVVAVIMRTGIVWCEHGHCGLSGEGGFIIFDISGNPDNYGLQELLPVAILGVVGGVLGSLFNQINGKIIMWRNGWLKK